MVSNMRRRDRALNSLIALLAQPEFAQGNQLPPERELAIRLKLSRSALREGLEVLEAEGRIWRHVGQGTFVGNRPTQQPPALSMITAHTSPSEMLETRLLVEPLLARMAALRATEAEIADMQRLLEKSEAAHDAKTWELWDGRLHRAIAEAAHNGLLLSIFDAFNAMRRQAKWGALRQAALTPARHTAYCAHHRAYVDAIADRDPQRAEEVMRRHIEAVREGLLGAAAAAAAE
jgi:DNA-binding FadR family transcriptional regulator